MMALTIILGGEKLESKTLKKMHERIIKNFMDIIILAELRNGAISGYDVISFIHNKFHLLVSSGTVYSLLYSLERNGLIEGTWNEKKTRLSAYRKRQKNDRNNTKCQRQNQELHNRPPQSPIHTLKTSNTTFSNRNTKEPLPKSFRTKKPKAHERARSSVRIEHRAFKKAHLSRRPGGHGFNSRRAR